MRWWIDLLGDDILSANEDRIQTLIASTGTELAASTLIRRYATLNSFRSWSSEATGAHYSSIAMLKGSGIVAPGKPKETAEALSPSECRVLLAAARETNDNNAVRNHAIIRFMLTVPMRRSAVSRMDVEHLSLGSHTPFVFSPKTRGDLPLRYTVPSSTAAELRSHMKHYGIASGPLWRSHSRRTPGGRPTPTSIYRIVRETALMAGLPDIGAHTLRHTGCTLAIDNGASLQQVQTHARHKQIETTMVYVHQRDRLRDSAADFIKVDESSDT